MSGKEPLDQPPPAEDIHRAIDLYLARAYSRPCPADVLDRLPPAGPFDPASYLAGEKVERRTGPPAPGQGEWFAIRLGNEIYPHMKLKIVFLPLQRLWLYSVDSHDTFLHAPDGSSDADGLTELKAHNAALAGDIETAWDRAGLLTAKGLLRLKIKQRKDRARPSRPAGEHDE